ncbi:hypothetical protein QUF63_07940 [Anaerolineales bacterium HSG25]|nr:hypothetical protein [Anaerolineales bacterium HSG25]
MLRPRLDGLLGNEDLATRDDDWIKKDLDAVFKNIKPTQFLPALALAYNSAPQTVQHRLSEVIPSWLTEHDYHTTLVQIIQKNQIGMAERAQIKTWLEATGQDLSTIEARIKAQTPFYRAYVYEDEFGSQGMILILWHTNTRQTKLQGLSFLIDYNPPWEGAIKDGWKLPIGSFRDVKTKVLDFWRQKSGEELQSISGEEAKIKLFTCLNKNLSESIKLPKDLIAISDVFWKYVPCLPDTEKAPSFTPQDFEFLSKHGESPEKINHFERNVGRRVRMDDGKELIVMGADDERNFWT